MHQGSRPGLPLASAPQRPPNPPLPPLARTAVPQTMAASGATTCFGTRCQTHCEALPRCSTLTRTMRGRWVGGRAPGGDGRLVCVQRVHHGSPLRSKACVTPPPTTHTPHKHLPVPCRTGCAQDQQDGAEGAAGGGNARALAFIAARGASMQSRTTATVPRACPAHPLSRRTCFSVCTAHAAHQTTTCGCERSWLRVRTRRGWCWWGVVCAR